MSEHSTENDVCEHDVPLVDYCRTCEQAMPSDTAEKDARWYGDYCPTGQHADGCCHACDHGYPVACICLEKRDTARPIPPGQEKPDA